MPSPDPETAGIPARPLRDRRSGSASAPRPEFRAFLERTPDIITCTDRHGRHLYVGPAIEMLGISADRLTGSTFSEAGLDEDFAARCAELLEFTTETGKVETAQFPYSRGDDERWLSAVVVPQFDDDGRVEAAWFVIRDITEQIRRQTALAAEAALDPLTGLSNRRGFLDAVTDGEPGPRALIFIDLDDFRRVNKSAGHRVGDEVLAAVAGRIASAVRPGDLVARWGGDEFVVLCGDIHPAIASTVAERILASVTEPVVVEGRVWPLSATCGVAAGVGDLDRLIAAADEVMRSGKEAGKSVVRVITL